MSRTRKHRWIIFAVAAFVIVAVGLWRLLYRPSPPAEHVAANRALEWMRTQQTEDGSFDSGFGHPAGSTCDAVLALAAVGGDAATWRVASDKPSVVDYLAAHAAEYAVDVASTGKLVATLVSVGLDPQTFAGTDWIARLQSFASGPGVYDAGTVGQAWAILALAAAGEGVPAQALSVLKSYQLDSGAWESPFGVDNDTVSYALQALAAGGEGKDSAAIGKALAFLQAQQNDDGGFPAIKPSEWGTDSNANSTASVAMALIAVGEDPTAARWSRGQDNPLTALLRLQASDGRIEFQPGVGNPLVATAQAIPALMGKALPLRPGR